MENAYYDDAAITQRLNYDMHYVAMLAYYAMWHGT